jgi:hypothetical protein
VRLDALPVSGGEQGAGSAFTETLLDRQQAFGYTQEDIKFLMAPMAARSGPPSTATACARRATWSPTTIWW